MWKKSRQEENAIDRCAKKFTIVTALLSAGALTLIILTMGYIYVKTWTPIRSFSAKKTNGGTKLVLEFTTKVPVSGYIEYGTNTLYTNQKEILGEIQGKATMTISPILPDKDHWVKFVTQTPDGRTFETDFLKVK